MKSESLTPISGWTTYRRLLTYLKSVRHFFLLSILGNLIYAGASAAMAPAMNYVVQAIETPSERMRLLVPILIILVFSLRGVGAFLSTYYIAQVARGVVHDLRRQVFDHMLRLPCAWYDRHTSGELLSRLTYNVEQVTGALTQAVTVLFREGLTVILLLSYMIWANWKLTLIFLAMGPLIGLLVSYVSKRFRRLSKRIQTSMGQVTQVAAETINGYRVMRVFGGEASERERFSKASEHNIQQQLKLAFTDAVSTPVIQSLIAVSIAFLVWLALSPEVLEDMTTGEFVAFLTAATTCAKPVRQLTSINVLVQRGIAAAEDVFALLAQAPEEDQGRFQKERAEGRLRFRQVGFTYPGSTAPVLKDIDFEIEPGETVAFVGASGSGKSTLVALVPRFHDPESGEILLDEVPLREWKLDSLRRQIALVNQQVTLFNDDVRHNIAYGELASHKDGEMRQAAEQAFATDFIEKLPEGYGTQLGDDGLLLSGGQRQRIAIARALLKDAPILILDEATSALDNQAEHHIQKALETVMQGRTTLVIAHRLSTIENADRIIVMDQGRIVEQGRHAELLEHGGLYAALHRRGFESDAEKPA